MPTQYKYMTEAQKRAVDERDVTILDMLAEGQSYTQIATKLGITAPTIRRVKKGCLDET